MLNPRGRSSQDRAMVSGIAARKVDTTAFSYVNAFAKHIIQTLRRQKKSSLHMRNGVTTSLPNFFAFSCSIDSATSFPTRLVLGEQERSLSSSERFHVRWLPRCGRPYRRHLPLYSHTCHGGPCCMFMLPYFKWWNSPLLLRCPWRVARHCRIRRED